MPCLPCTVMGSWSTHTKQTNFYCISINKNKLIILFDLKNYAIFSKIGFNYK